jgi:hypothetical protein
VWKDKHTHTERERHRNTHPVLPLPLSCSVEGTFLSVICRVYIIESEAQNTEEEGRQVLGDCAARGRGKQRFKHTHRDTHIK